MRERSGKRAHFGGRTKGVYLITLSLEDHAKRTADVLLVVDYQNAPVRHLTVC